MTNFVYISPAFPTTNVNFCEHLANSGVTVLGIGDTPYFELPEKLTNALTEYYWVASLEDYDQVFRAVAFLSFKHGRIDWLESNNEYWLPLDARLRTDFNITTGYQVDLLAPIRSKAVMKKVFQAAGIPTAEQIMVTDPEVAVEFADKVGYPVIVKPEYGMGAINTFKLNSADEVRDYAANRPAEPMVMEQFIPGNLVSYDAIVDSASEPVFEAFVQWPPSIMDIVLEGLDLAYQVSYQIPEKLREYGTRIAKAFGAQNRFIHLEFFELTEPVEGIGDIGDFVVLEANMRPAGGVTPDMYNYASSADAYQIYTDLVTGNDTGAAARAKQASGICAFASRRDYKQYQVGRDELLNKYGGELVRVDRNREIDVPQQGNEIFVMATDSQDRVDEFMSDVLRTV